MNQSIRRSYLRILFFVVAFCLTLAADGFDAVAQSSRDRSILLARQLAECSGAYYASSEAVTSLTGSSDKALSLQEEGNGFLLASARILTSTKPGDGFDSAYQRVEERANNLKFAWLKRLSDMGDAGVVEINRATEFCAQKLEGQKDDVLRYMREEIHN